MAFNFKPSSFLLLPNASIKKATVEPVPTPKIMPDLTIPAALIAASFFNSSCSCLFILLAPH